MNKKHLVLLLALSILFYNLFRFFAGITVSLAMVSFLFTSIGIVKCRNYTKSANYFAIGFVAAIISLYKSIQLAVDDTLSFELLLSSFLAVFCGMMCFMIFIDETDSYRLNLKHSKLKLISFTSIVLVLYLLAF